MKVLFTLAFGVVTMMNSCLYASATVSNMEENQPILSPQDVVKGTKCPAITKNDIATLALKGEISGPSGSWAVADSSLQMVKTLEKINNLPRFEGLDHLQYGKKVQEETGASHKCTYTLHTEVEIPDFPEDQFEFTLVKKEK